jgi:MATE family, multidrug efflux pump
MTKAVASHPEGKRNPKVERSLEGSIPRVLVEFAAPGLLQIFVQSAVAVLEILLLSHLGTETLAGISAVFPVTTLFIAITQVGWGGGVASAIARSLGAGDRREAEAIAMHAVLLAVLFGVLSAALLVGVGPQLLSALGAKGASLDKAVAYSNLVFGGSVSLWLLGGLTAVIRGSGDMKTPARIAVYRSALSVPLFMILIFGWGPIVSLGIRGAAVAMLTYYTLGVVWMVWHLQSNASPVHLRLRGFEFRQELAWRILKVALPSSVQMLVANIALLAVTALVARFGTEALAGYGLASRLELLVSSLVLAFGVGTTTLVGTCVGAGAVARARRATFVSCALAGGVFQAIGICLAVSGPWITSFFTDAPSVAFASIGYFRAVGLVYGFLGVSMMLFSAYQGWGRTMPPLLVSLFRVAVVLLGGWFALQQPAPRLEWLYGVVSASFILAALMLGAIFIFRPPERQESAVFR